jgi:hypothetical protein
MKRYPYQWKDRYEEKRAGKNKQAEMARAAGPPGEKISSAVASGRRSARQRYQRIDSRQISL